MTLTKNSITEQIHRETGNSLKDSRDLLEMVIEEIKLQLEEGAEVKISGFGKWRVQDKRQRPGRNPYTGEKIQISARKIVTFRPSEKLRKSLNEESDYL